MPATDQPVPAFHISLATGPQDLDEVRRLLGAYAQALEVDLAFQGFEAELAGLPGAYAPPGGVILIARDAEGRSEGCVAMQPDGAEGACEMRRLYVSPEGRRLGIGSALVDAVLKAARGAGYGRMRLEALPGMTAALTLYRTRGFRAIPPYYDSPIAGSVFLECDLASLPGDGQ